MSERIYLNEDWFFTEHYSSELNAPDYDDTSLSKVRIPHTCKETPLHYFDESIYQMVSGYRRKLFVPKEWRGKVILLTFEGAAHDSRVFCNGSLAGEHHCGYTAFTIDLTQLLAYGAENILTVQLDSRETLNIPPFGYVIDYMTYGGIYRDVYLEVKNPVYLEDIFVSTEIDGQDSDACVRSKITLSSSNRKELLVRHWLCPKEETEAMQMIGEHTLADSEEKEYEVSFSVNSPMLWDIDHPNLYLLKTQLWEGDVLLDEAETVFGFRQAVFQKDGFYLNGRKVTIRGLNRHQSYPYIGYAAPEGLQKLDADLLKKELGVNAVRTSHYPQSHYFLDRCDQLGLLVFTELPGWQYIGDEAWKAQAIANVEDMVRQYRNHPSIILWGVRINESPDEDTFYEKTNETAHRLDPTRQTGGVRAIRKSRLLEDVYTYNDFLYDGKNAGCQTKKAVTSDLSKSYLVSEYNGHMYPTKAFDNEKRRAEHAVRHANVLDAIAGGREIAGSFGWCMFDYNTHKDFGSGDRICYHGVMDMFRNPKLAACAYACEQETTPILEISSSMDIGEHSGCNRGTIWIFTNADSVRMYKNDHFIKEYTPDMSPFHHLKHGPIVVDDFIGNALEQKERFRKKHARQLADAMNTVARGSLNHIPKRLYPTALKLALLYHTDFEEITKLYTRYIGDWGETATVYRFEAIKDGKTVKTVIKEPVNSYSLSAHADHTKLCEKSTYDAALVRIRAVDGHGNVLPFFQEPVKLYAEGAVELIGPEVISLQGGMGGTFVRSKGIEGQGKLSIQTMNGEAQQILFSVETCLSCKTSSL